MALKLTSSQHACKTDAYYLGRKILSFKSESLQEAWLDRSSTGRWGREMERGGGGSIVQASAR